MSIKMSERLMTLIESLVYPACIIDSEGKIVSSNSVFRERFQCTGTAKCYDVIHPDQGLPEPCPVMGMTSTSGECIIKGRDSRYYKESVSPLPATDTERLFILTFTDVTSLRQKELESREIVELYAEVVNQLKQKELRAEKGREAFFNMLEDLNESYIELEDLFIKIIRVMVNALDAKSSWTRGHSERVARYAEKIAVEMGMDEDETREIRLAGLLHDIGKIGTYDYLLEKPGPLTPEEYEMVKQHPQKGVDILKDIKQLSRILPFIKYHHERIDGKGYPSGIKDNEIPLGAKILHVADSFDSMTSDRPYRKAPGREYAISELKRFSGIQFDRDVVDAFLRVLQDSKKLNDSYTSTP